MFNLFLRVAVLVGLSFYSTSQAQELSDFAKIQHSGILKVAVYQDFPPYSNQAAGIDIDLAQALTSKLGLTLRLLPFPAGEDVGDDLRNMVWKGHYLGYGPADVMLHVPIDPILSQQQDKVLFFAPYQREQIKLVTVTRSLARFDGLTSLAGKQIGVEKVSLAAMLLLGAENGMLRDTTHFYANGVEAVKDLKTAKLDAVFATQAEIESALSKDTGYAMHEVHFPRMPKQTWVIGMAIKKTNVQLHARLQQAYLELQESGELDRIFAQHGVTRNAQNLQRK